MVSLTSFCTSSPTSPAGRPCTPAKIASRRCRFWRRITSGLDTGSIVGHRVQRDRRAVLRRRPPAALRIWSTRSRCVLRQAQQHLDLLAVGRGPVGRDLAVDVGAQARRELRRGQAELAHRAGLQPHRVGRQARLDRQLDVDDAGDLLHLLGEVGRDAAPAPPGRCRGSRRRSAGRSRPRSRCRGSWRCGRGSRPRPASACACARCGRLRPMFSVAWLRPTDRPLPVPPTLVDTVFTSGKAATISSTWRTLASLRSRLEPTGMRTDSCVKPWSVCGMNSRADQRRQRERADEARHARRRARCRAGRTRASSACRRRPSGSAARTARAARPCRGRCRGSRGRSPATSSGAASAGPSRRVDSIGSSVKLTNRLTSTATVTVMPNG